MPDKLEKSCYVGQVYTSVECKSIIIAVLAVMSMLSVVLTDIVLIFTKKLSYWKNMGSGLWFYLS